MTYVSSTALNRTVSSAELPAAGTGSTSRSSYRIATILRFRAKASGRDSDRPTKISSPSGESA
jgi:hypothetical protein